MEFNYFYINNYFYHQIKGTAIGTIFAIVGSNLTLSHFDKKKCLLFYHIFILKFLLTFQKYVLFSDDVFNKWLIQFDNIHYFYKIMNELDPDLQFIFEELTTNITFLDITLTLINNKSYSFYSNFDV